MTQVLEEKNSYLSDFAEAEPRLASKGAAWLAPIQKAAIKSFTELGFPTLHDEAWRFTNVAPLTKIGFKLAGPGDLASPADGHPGALVFKELAGSTLVFLNGHFAPALSSIHGLPVGVKVMSLAEAIEKERSLVEPHLARHANSADHAFVALNTAFLSDGAFVHIPKGVVVEQPIHLVYVSTAGEEPTVSHPRSLIIAGEASQSTILETYASISPDVYFTNAVTEIIGGENSVIDHYKLQQESEAAYHFSRTQLNLARSANFTSHSLLFGAALTRNEVSARLDGEGIECVVNGLYMTGGSQHVDNHMLIDHAKPHCNSHELFKGILDGKSNGVFSGKIIVRQDAQKTDAKQSNKNLLLSGTASIDTQPQLEIFANDVKCTHGATIGQLDAEAIFYLRARGISEREARGLLTYAFANDIVERVKIAEVKERVGVVLAEKFRRDSAAI